MSEVGVYLGIACFKSDPATAYKNTKATDQQSEHPCSLILAFVDGFLDNMSRVVRKPAFAYAKTKTQISFAVTAKLISAFVFATRIVQSLYFLNPKFQASSHLLWLYSAVCVGPGRKPRRPVFSQRGSYIVYFITELQANFSC